MNILFGEGLSPALGKPVTIETDTGHTIKSEPFHKGIGEYYDKQIGVKK